MAHPRPIIRSIRVLGIWTGEPDDPVDYKITFKIHASPDTRLPLLDLTSERVDLVHVSNPYDPLMHIPSPYEAAVEPVPRSRLLSPYPFSPPEKGQHESNDEHAGSETKHQVADKIRDSSPLSEDIENKENIPAASQGGRTKVMNVSLQESESSLPTIDICLSSESSFTPEYYRDKDFHKPASPALSTPRLTVKKRSNNSPSKLSTSPTQEKFVVTKRIRHPVPLAARPPWRTPGADDAIVRGRKTIHGKEEVTTRKISHSADGRFQTAKDHGRRERSASPRSQMKAVYSMDDLKIGTSRPFAAGTVVKIAPKKRMTMALTTDDVLNPSSSACAHVPSPSIEASESPRKKGASPLLERWLESRRSLEEVPQKEQDADDTSDSHTVRSSRSIMSLGADSMEDNFQNLEGTSFPARSPSVTPPSLTGSRNIDNLENDMITQFEESLTKELPWVRKCDKLWLEFHKDARQNCEVVVKAKVKGVEHPEGGLILSIPGLPLQYDNLRGEGHFMIIIATDEAKMGIWNNRDNIRWVREEEKTKSCFIEELDEGRQYGPFPLDKVYGPRFVPLEPIKVLTHDQYELDYVLSERKDLTSGLVTFTATCILRPAKFIFWSEQVAFKVCLSGGPAGATLDTLLAPGSRHIHLRSRQVDPSHQLYLVITCPTAEWGKAFKISWEGPVTGERLYPSISGGCTLNTLDIQKLQAGQSYGQDLHELGDCDDVDLLPSRATGLATPERKGLESLLEYLQEDGSIAAASDFGSREANISRLRKKAAKRSRLQSVDHIVVSDLKDGTSIAEDLSKLTANASLKFNSRDPRAGTFQWDFTNQTSTVIEVLRYQCRILSKIFVASLAMIGTMWLCCWVAYPYDTITWTWQARDLAVQHMSNIDIGSAFSTIVPSDWPSNSYSRTDHSGYGLRETMMDDIMMEPDSNSFDTPGYDVGTEAQDRSLLMSDDSLIGPNEKTVVIEESRENGKKRMSIRDRIDRLLGWPGAMP